MEIVTSWMEEGLQRGRQEGLLQTLREDIIEVLEARFGELPYELREAIQAIANDTALKRLLRLAAVVTGLEDFRRQLKSQ